jgi:hypothetical protein
MVGWPSKDVKGARKRHIRTAGSEVCPYCKADNDMCGMNIEYGDLDPVEDGDIQQEVKCLQCGRRWMDIYRLVDVHELCP